MSEGVSVVTSDASVLERASVPVSGLPVSTDDPLHAATAASATARASDLLKDCMLDG